MVRNLDLGGAGGRGSESSRRNNLCKHPQSGNMVRGNRRTKARGVARCGPNAKFVIRRVCALFSHHMELVKHAHKESHGQACEADQFKREKPKQRTGQSRLYNPDVPQQRCESE